MNLTKDGIPEYLGARCRAEHGCMIWAGCMGGAKRATPVARLNGKMQTVRRVLAGLVHGEAAITGKHVLACCGDERCVSLAHLRVMPRDEAAALLMKSGRGQNYADPLVSLHRRRAQQVRSPTLGVIDEIRKRLAAGERQKKIADDLGRSPSTISNIARKVRWADGDLQGMARGSSVFNWAGGRA